MFVFIHTAGHGRGTFYVMEADFSGVSSVQVPVFQRGGSVVCRSTGSGSCTAEYQQLPLSITVALNTEVSRPGGRNTVIQTDTPDRYTQLYFYDLVQHE